MIEREVTGQQRARAARSQKKLAKRGLAVERYFTTPGVDPADELAWETRTAAITGEGGEIIFEQKDVEVPKTWSLLATNVVASKYFRGTLGTPERERSVRQLVARVVRHHRRLGAQGRLLRRPRRTRGPSTPSSRTSSTGRRWLQLAGLVQRRRRGAPAVLGLLHQLGRRLDGLDPRARPDRGHALQVRLGHRLQPLHAPLLAGAARRRRHGLRPGLLHARLRRLRRRHQVAAARPAAPRRWSSSTSTTRTSSSSSAARPTRRRRPGRSSTPATTAASTSRAAPTTRSSSRTRTTRSASPTTSCSAVLEDGEWSTASVTDGKVARDASAPATSCGKMAEAAWLCGDPGMQFDTTINDWHTCPNTDAHQRVEPVLRVHVPRRLGLQPGVAEPHALPARRRRASTSRRSSARWTSRSWRRRSSSSNASYPTERIGEEQRRLPPARARLREPRRAPHGERAALRLATAGAPCAAAITALMSRRGLRDRARASPSAIGPVRRLREEPRAVPRRHAQARAARRPHRPDAASPADAARRRPATPWDDALALGDASTASATRQVTVLAPTGTIGFMMDCDTTGIEPDIALVKYKKLVGGGMLKIVNHTVPLALQRLGYSDTEVERDRRPVHRRGGDDRGRAGPQGRAPAGVRLRLQAAERHALDPLHGPHPDDGGGPAVPLGRDLQDGQHARPTRRSRTSRTPTSRPGSSASRPSPSTATAASGASRSTPARRSDGQGGGDAGRSALARRRACPTSAASITHKFSIGGHEGYMTVGMYDDGTPGELFVTHGEGGLGRRRPDGLLRDGDLDGAPVRRAAARCSSTSSATPASSRRASPATRRSRSPSRSPTTSSAGWR